jgi:hypothetical protein
VNKTSTNDVNGVEGKDVTGFDPFSRDSIADECAIRQSGAIDRVPALVAGKFALVVVVGVVLQERLTSWSISSRTSRVSVLVPVPEYFALMDINVQTF